MSSDPTDFTVTDPSTGEEVDVSDSGSDDSGGGGGGGGGGSSDDSGGSDDDSRPVQEGDFGGAFDDVIDNRDDSGSSDGGDDLGGDVDSPSDPSDLLPDEPDTDTDNPFADSGGSSGSSGSDDSPPVGNTPSSGNLPSQSGDSPDTGQGIGPDGASGSEASTPDSETDSPNNDSTENIEATRTGRLEDTASDPEIRQQAQSLEQQVAGQKVTDVVSGLTTTGAELRPEDVEVTRDGDTLEASLSPVGEERVQNIAERQADEQAERAVEAELNTSFDNSDVSVDNSGNVGVSEDVQNEATEQALAEQNPGVSEDDVTFQNGQPQVEQPEQPNPADQLEERTGLEEGQDFTIDDGQVNVTRTGAQELRGRREQQEGDALTPLVQDVEGVTGVDLPGNTSEAGEAREQAANDPAGELFGGRGEIERQLRDASEGFSSAVESVADPFGEAAAANPLVDIVDPAPDGTATDIESATSPQDQQERNQAELFGGVASGPAEVLNPAALAVTGIEAGEAANEGVEATAVAGGTEEDFESFEDRAAGGAALQATDTTRAAQENPFDTAGTVVGGAIGATGLLRAGRSIGGTTGARTAGAVVQPGEELLKALRRSDADGGSTSTATANTQLGSGGTGSLLDADSLDVGRGPSTMSRVRGEIERSDTVQRVRDRVSEFTSPGRLQAGLVPQRRNTGGDSGGGSSSPDAPSDFDPSRSEVLEGSPRDQLAGDVTDRARQQRRQNRGTGPQQQSDAGRTRPEPEGARRRREQAQRQEATQEPRTPGRSEAGRRAGEQVGTGVGAGAGVGGLLDDDSQQTIEDALGVGTGTDAAETVEETLGVDVGSGTGFEFDTGFDTEFGQEFRSELGTETRQDTRQEFGQEIGQEPGTEAGTEIGTEVGTEIGTETQQEQRRETGFGTEFGTETRREIELDFGNDADDERELEGFGETSDTFDTGFATSEEIAGFGGSDSEVEEELFGNSGSSVF